MSGTAGAMPRTTPASPLSMLLVIGCARSGTTLLTDLLGQLPGMDALPETKYFQYIYSQRHLLALLPRSDRAKRVADCLETAEYPRTEPRFPSKREAVMESLLSSKNLFEEFQGVLTALSSEPILVEKTPWHTVFAGIIARKLPDSRFIAVTRDVPAVVASLLGREGFRGAGSLLSCAARWSVLNGMILDLAASLGTTRMKVVRFEDLVTSPEQIMQELADWLDIKDLIPPPRPVGQDSSLKPESGQVYAGGFDKGVLDRWRTILSPEEENLVRGLTGKVAGRLGYPAGRMSGRPRDIMVRIAYLFHVTALRTGIALMRSGFYPVGAFRGITPAGTALRKNASH